MEIADGEFIVIVGPSGCGKSTLLRMVAGLERISGGEMAIDGRVVNELEPKDRDIAMVFQNYALYPHMSVYHKTPWRRPAEDREEWARTRSNVGCRRLPAFLEIGLVPAAPAAPAFRGPAPACVMGRAIVREPEGLPVRRTALQPRRQARRVQMRVEIKKLQRQLGVTSIYAYSRPGRGDDAGRPPDRHE